MFKCMNNLAPSYLVSLFCKRSQIHSCNTDNLHPPRCRTELALFSVEKARALQLTSYLLSVLL